MKVKSYGFIDKVNEVNKCLENKTFYAALCLALTLPDICAKRYFEFHGIKGIKKDEQKYRWILDNYGDESRCILNHYLIYKLRCSIVHNGIIDTSEYVDFYLWIDATSEPTIGFSKSFDGNNIKSISLYDLCKFICDSVTNFYNNSEMKIKDDLNNYFSLNELFIEGP